MNAQSVTGTECMCISQWHVFMTHRSGLEPCCGYVQAIGVYTIVHTWADLSSGCQQRDILGFSDVPGLPISLQYSFSPSQLTLFLNRGTQWITFLSHSQGWNGKKGCGGGRDNTTVVQMYCRVNYKIKANGMETHEEQTIDCLMHRVMSQKDLLS